MSERGEIPSFSLEGLEKIQESSPEAGGVLSLKDRVREFVTSLKQSGAPVPDIGELSDEPVNQTERIGGSVLEKFRALPSAFRKGLMAMVLVSEAAAAQTVLGQKGQKEHYKTIRGEVQSRPQTEVRFGPNYMMIENDETGIFVKHNFRWPESLAEAGKMFVEPLSFGMKFTTGRDSWTAKVITGSASDEDFIFSADIPYEYARDFEKASPIDQKKMEEDMEKKARALVEKILPAIIGVSFFKDDAKTMTRQNAGKIKEMTIEGFASGETDAGIDRNDERNQRLSELRAENAAYVLRKVLKDNGIEAEEIKYQGKGELHLTEAERTQLLKDATSIKIGPDGLPEEARLVELVRRYNDGRIKQSEIKERLDQFVGEKRKVAVTIETDQRRYVLILPLPLLLPLLARLIPGRDGSYPPALYAHFFESPPPGSEVRLNTEDRGAARGLGRRLRRDDPIYTEPVRRSQDVVKGYSGRQNPMQEYRDEVVAGTRHWRKRDPRERVILGFDPAVPEQTRVEALAFVLDRYARMTGSLTQGRSFGRLRRRNFDLINVYRDRQAMQSLLRTIARREGGERGQNAPVDISLAENSQVRFEFRGIAPRRGGIAHRRQALYGARVTVDGCRYEISRPELWNLANHYRATHTER